MESKEYSIYDFSIYFDSPLFDHYIKHPDPKHEGQYITNIGGIKVGFGPKYMLKKIITVILPKIYPSGKIPANQIEIRKIPTVSEPVIRRLGEKKVSDDKVISLQEGPEPLKPRLLEPTELQRDEGMRHDIALGVSTARLKIL